ncbi:hypothetical protein FRB91_000238 [Serendipita sp. 411]|nr:hypothetical protein FRC19_008727 [Serendipita sp. 401]KAG8847065.1 hypothetical protein FRB91_000238 [Serendipita sp. 411]KAG9047200.1 hypothetical protein FS842_000705 [Serendipita sp. 407]
MFRNNAVNAISFPSPNFILCKAVGEGQEDPCLLLDRKASFCEVLDQIHQYWGLGVSPDKCGWKPESAPGRYTQRYASNFFYSLYRCSVELLFVGGGITTRLLSPTWDSLKSNSDFNVLYWRYRRPKVIKAATPTVMILATVAEMKDDAD